MCRLICVDCRKGVPAKEVVLDLKPRGTKAQVLDACKGHILVEAQLMGRFGR